MADLNILRTLRTENVREVASQSIATSKTNINVHSIEYFPLNEYV